jgi:hypothetical protein
LRGLDAAWLTAAMTGCTLLAWLRDYERTIAHHEAMLYWATVFIMTKRLTRYKTGQTPTRPLGRRAIPPRPASGFTNRL